ncbi:EAL domain-containing protein [Sandaracinobacteroides saxicola]|uniref:EAL domain-containing protein n=1 Tax=Sandaracinobacteroides saxicola TaxID=2759707 RepID=A0A7G5IKZ8_9SPHN|nr:EAL domain-containing protein [Sandaracinobacteroides saxicola]
MSALFKPPVATEQNVHWREMFGLANDNPAFWDRVRAQQVNFLTRYFPMNLVIMLANGAMVLLLLGPLGDPRFVTGWTISVGLLALWWLRGLWKMQQSGLPTDVPRRELAKISIELLLMGVLWGSLALHFMPFVEGAHKAMLIALMFCALGVCAFTTAIMPLGALALGLPIFGMTFIALVGRNDNVQFGLEIILASFAAVITRGVLLTSFAFIARLKTANDLAEREEVIRLLLNEYETNGSDWLFELDRNGALTFVSTRLAQAAGQDEAALLGRTLPDLLAEQGAAKALAAHLAAGQSFRDVQVPVRIGDETHWWSLSATPKRDRNGGYRGVGRDVTQQYRSAERINQLATFDPLTGLVNRRLVHARLGDSLARAAHVALLFVDLDRFKAVNDSLGHGAGDALLVEVATRLRVAAGPKATVGRLGGDEFAVVLTGIDALPAVRIAETIIASLSQPYQLGDVTPAIIGASVGLAVGPHDGATVEDLLRAADLALYEAKAHGRGQVRSYDRAMHQAAEERRSLELDLRQALDRGELWLAFQPIVDAHDEHLTGFEALLRWTHPQRGNIPPGVFVPLAEETGLIDRIGQWVLHEACVTAAGWATPLTLSVNLSPRQFDNPQLPTIVRNALDVSGLTPSRLELEVTEGLFLADRAPTLAMLAELQALGVGFALDDFGTGYSSLGYLQTLAFNRIKIDRSFVAGCAHDRGESVAIVQAIVALANRLGMDTTAEGTETRDEYEAMRALGCGHMQGYLFGRPMSATDAAALAGGTLPLSRSRPAWAALPPPTPPAGDGQSPSAAVPSSFPFPPRQRQLQPG